MNNKFDEEVAIKLVSATSQQLTFPKKNMMAKGLYYIQWTLKSLGNDNSILIIKQLVE